MNKALAAIAAGALALTLTACGGPAAQPGSGASGTTAAATWDINETPRDKVKDGGELHLSISDKVPNWNVRMVDANNKEYSDLVSPISPVYYDYNSAGEPVMNKDYLEDVKEETVDGNLVITLKLNPKAKWNDGSVIGAEDWIATWKAQNESDTNFKPAATDGWKNMTEVKQGANAQEVVITYKGAFPDWTQQISGGPMHRDAAKTPAEFNDGQKTFKDQYYTGPFKVETVDKATGKVTMVPNPNWWGEKPKLAKITWEVIPPETQATAYAAKTIDFLDIASDPDAYAKAKETPGGVIRKAGGPNFRHFTFNSKGGFLSDVKVRQAVVMGLNREVIAASDLAALDWEPKPLNNNLFVEGQTGYVDEAAATGITYDPEKAKKTLEEAGWKMNDQTKYYEKDGKTLEIRYGALAGVKSAENEGLQAEKMLKEVGIKLKIHSVPVEKFQDGSVLTNHEFDIISFSWIGTPYPLGNISQIYGTGAESNFAQLSMPKVDDLAKKIAVEMDKDKRLQMADEVAKEIWTNVHTLPLYQRPELKGQPEKLANYGAFGFGTVKWTDVGFIE